MPFLTRSGASPFGANPFMHALGEWRVASHAVTARWEAYLAADRADRPRVFAAFTAALDAEAAAASELEQLQLREAA
jgi:hypothetical protein